MVFILFKFIYKFIHGRVNNDYCSFCTKQKDTLAYLSEESHDHTSSTFKFFRHRLVIYYRFGSIGIK